MKERCQEGITLILWDCEYCIQANVIKEHLDLKTEPGKSLPCCQTDVYSNALLALFSFRRLFELYQTLEEETLEEE